MTITTKQLEALRAYAKVNGHTWKSQLRRDWQVAQYWSVPQTIWCYLQQLRGIGGTWLDKFQFPAEVPQGKTYIVRLVHKISPSDKDVQEVQLDPEKLNRTKDIAAELRRTQILLKGQRLIGWRYTLAREIVAFPAASIWHSIIITEKASQPEHCPICHEKNCDGTKHERAAEGDEDCRGGAPRP